MLNELSTRAYVAMQTRSRKQEGASAVEYGLILGLVAVVIIATLILLGDGLDDLFGTAQTAVTDAATTPTP